MNTTELLSEMSRHQGRDRGICAADLARLCNVSPRELRSLISALREEGTAICATPGTGHYLATTPEELPMTYVPRQHPEV